MAFLNDTELKTKHVQRKNTAAAVRFVKSFGNCEMEWTQEILFFVFYERILKLDCNQNFY